MERANQYFVSFSLLLVPVLMVLYKSIASIYISICLLWSLALVCVVAPKSIFHKWEKLLICTVLVYVLLALMNLFWTGYNYHGAKQLGYIIRLIAVVPILLILHRSRPNLHLFMWGVIIAALMSFFFAVYEIDYSGMIRAKGSTDSILFGCFSILFASISGLYAIYWVKQRRVVNTLLGIISFSCGLVAALASGTRGALIAVPIIIVIQLSYAMVLSDVQRKMKVAIVAVIFSGLAMGSFLVPDSGYKRFYVAVKEISTYQPGQGTSIGRRLDAWYEAYVAFLENPIFGIGHGRQYAFVEAKVKAGMPGMGSAQLSDSHSDYFFILSRRGGLGLLSHLILLLILSCTFFTIWRKASSNIQVLAAACGVVVISSYAIFGFTSTLFIRSQALCIFAYLLAVLMYFSTNGNSSDELHERLS